MPHRILLSFRSGSFETGFEGEVQIAEADRPYHVTQPLQFPPAPALLTAYDRWQQAYLDWGQAWRLTIPSQVTNIARQADLEVAKQTLVDRGADLHKTFGDWLQPANSWSLQKTILRQVPPRSSCQFLLHIPDSLDPLLKKLPWYLWDFLQEEDYRDLEMVLSSGNHEQIRPRPKGPIKILALFSRAEGLNVSEEEQFLTALPNTAITVLNQPSRAAFVQALTERPWDIVYFAGHSQSNRNCDDGRIYINDSPEGLSPRELRESFTKAIDQGLQLVLLNSCDGLGLAQSLAELKLPRSIVMREPVPDPVAPLFLRYLLTSLRAGVPLHRAMREARRQLQDGHGDLYPCAAALPILCQNPAAPEPRWQWRDRRPWRLPLLLGTIGVVGLLLGLGGYSLSQKLWLRSRISGGDHILFQASADAPDSPHKRLGAAAIAQGNYEEAVRQFSLDWQRPQSRDPETLTYLNNAKIGKRPHFKIAASLPIGSNPEVAAEILRGIAQRQQEINDAGGINGKLLWVELANDNNSADDVKPIAHHYVGDRQTLAVIGSNASNASIPASEIYNRGSLLMLSPTSFTDRLRTDNTPYSARMVSDARTMAESLAKYYLPAHPQAQIALCFDSQAPDNNAFSKAFEDRVNIFNADHGGNAQLLTPAKGLDCQLDSPQFNGAAKAKELIDRGVDTVLLSPYIDRIPLAMAMAQELAREAKDQAKRRPQLLGTPTLFTGKTLEAPPDAVTGLKLIAPWNGTAVPGSRFPAEAMALWGGPVSWRTAMAYDAVLVVRTGLAHGPTRSGLLWAFSQTLAGATGKIEFGGTSGERVVTSSLNRIMEITVQPGQPHGIGFAKAQ
jgi:branched-chain amino acid transport system substrate-binding protein